MSVRGSDAARLLNRVSTALVVEPYQNGPIAFLTGRGKLICWGFLFCFLKTDNDPQQDPQFDIATPRQWAPLLVDYLLSLVFREKVTCALSEESHVGVMHSGIPIPASLSAQPSQKSVGVEDQARSRICPWPTLTGVFVHLRPLAHGPEPSACLGPQQSETQRQWEYFFGQAGFFGPLPSEDQFLALELGVEPFLCRNKGCYPGQEVVERILNYGGLRKRLAVLKTESEKEVASAAFTQKERELLSTGIRGQPNSSLLLAEIDSPYRDCRNGSELGRVGAGMVGVNDPGPWKDTYGRQWVRLQSQIQTILSEL